MDDADVTEPRIRRGVDEAIEACRATPGLKRTGRCHHCNEKVEHLFCDDDCRQDWQHRKERNQANGK